MDLVEENEALYLLKGPYKARPKVRGVKKRAV
jgi:hypothetical protein